jgi:hypothetical protein
MTKSSAGRIFRKKSEKLRLKAKRELLKEYPKLMESPEERKKAFDLIDNANVAVDNNGNVKVMYDKNKDLNSLN